MSSKSRIIRFIVDCNTPNQYIIECDPVTSMPNENQLKRIHHHKKTDIPQSKLIHEDLDLLRAEKLGLDLTNPAF
ncbi:hypothetical protein TVAG_529120 [Trichomonas vaginalis G3]|uniref:Uncharacterized protein n=1 Tax=Trichomonas vaginalis (strain ATCC PRA-98 / G3) TaxID=412133 RepID=A2GR75_TRIV3|nr:hypothetical protein TVAGG3_0700400 [Trichomonas vaginalis G3]XP_051102234.1 hypothetical protein TVAGG3_0396220 [Trichomonas vaginalis G3]EAX70461.1 hypothetical protein TVAG_449430 [Trichomonas vaginalis G3]EAX80342.1 hypothetical protein TVAG_529120 [Trichomonas vaginalis G3]KAI5509208.1 hypothetical protein TVAGG3_0700400 [Trichomonas vaginalis G3]KAI5534358.1 hypothetical protein TVAGG3_0396220 [Trichomonas vaginalis G3]|eukprot:XP_001283391.1 hypothetical protein [Trichomonas vaginalis G3]